MRYSRNAVFIAILIAAAMKLFGGAGLSISRDSEASGGGSYPPGIASISASQLAKTVLEPSATPTFVLIYASWCPYCKRQFPEVEKLAAEYQGKIRFLTVSIDRTPHELAGFLGDRAGNERFSTYIYGEEDTRLLAQKLNQMGARFSGAVPFSALFDGKGKLLAQFGGLAEAAELKAAMEKSL